MSLTCVKMSEDVWLTCLTHALSTETEEIMGLLLGDIEHSKDGHITALIWGASPQSRSDRRKDRVETNPEQLAAASAQAERMTASTGRRTRVIGWYHSHPHITVLPSHVDVRTQSMYQLLDSGFVGLIFSCFSEDTNKVGRIQVIAFQSSDGKQNNMSGPVLQSPVNRSSVIDIESSLSSLENSLVRSGSTKADGPEEDTGDSQSTLTYSKRLSRGETKLQSPAMGLDSDYEVTRAAEFILSRSFTRVALQFPDELLKDSTKVVSALRTRLRSLKEANGGEQKEIGLFVMADPTYGSCCIDEVGASHVDADCVIHYGHTCLSPTSNLPVLFVFGETSINIPSCLENLLILSLTNDKPIVVLYGLEYTHAIPHIREELVKYSRSCGPKSKGNIYFAYVMCSTLSPSEDHKNSKGVLGILGGCTSSDSSVAEAGTRCSIGSLIWDIPEGRKWRITCFSGLDLRIWLLPIFY